MPLRGRQKKRGKREGERGKKKKTRVLAPKNPVVVRKGNSFD